MKCNRADAGTGSGTPSARVFEHSTSTGASRLVLLVIAFNVEDDGTTCWLSVGEIAQWTRLAERTVRRAVRALTQAGELETVRRNEILALSTYRVHVGPDL